MSSASGKAKIAELAVANNNSTKDNTANAKAAFPQSGTDLHELDTGPVQTPLPEKMSLLLAVAPPLLERRVPT